MRIKKVTIKGLFGLFDHVIPLNIDERITIIHGPNGVGKTTILKVDQSIYQNVEFLPLKRTPFEQLTIEFHPKKLLTVTRLDKADKKDQVQLRFTLKSGAEKSEFSLDELKATRELRRERPFPLSIISDLIDQLEWVGRDEWYDSDSDDTITLEQVLFQIWTKPPD